MIQQGKARRIAFRIVVSLASLFLLVALLSAYPLVIINWLPRDLWLAVRADHFHPDIAAGDTVHRLHSLALGVLAWGMLLGIVLQAHRPVRRVGPLLAALAVPVAIAIGEMLAGTYTVGGTAPFLIVIVLVAVLHPAAGSLVRRPRWSRPMFGLVALATLPCVLYAVRMGTAARALDPGGFEVGHLTFMSALALLAILWGVIGATRHAAWWFGAVASGVAVASVGLQSMVFPDVLSGLSWPWALAALTWCVAYGGAAIVRTRQPASSGN